MKIEGYGGPILASRNDDDVINGVRCDDEGQALRGDVRWRTCASKFCEREFYSRQDGDYYCCEQCDIDMHPEFKTTRYDEDGRLNREGNEPERFGYYWNDPPLTKGFRGRRPKEGERT